MIKQKYSIKVQVQEHQKSGYYPVIIIDRIFSKEEQEQQYRLNIEHIESIEVDRHIYDDYTFETEDLAKEYGEAKANEFKAIAVLNSKAFFEVIK